MQQIKQRAVHLFEQGEFKNALHQLCKLDAEEFVLYLLNPKKKAERPSWLHHEECGKYFWNTFIIQPSIFHSMLHTENAKELVDEYFASAPGINDEFLLKLSREYPLILLESIRTRMIFLREEWQLKLALLESIPGFQAHVKAWNTLSRIENGLWKQVQQQMPLLDQYTLHDLLADVVIWLELKRFGKSNNHNIHFLARVYSFFIEKILPATIAYQNFATRTSTTDFFKDFLNRFQKFARFKEMNSPVSEIMDHIATWIQFMEGTCEPYCYDLQTEPIIEHELVSFRSSGQHHYATLVDGARYEVVQFRYLSAGTDLADYYEERGELVIPKGRKPEDEEINRSLAGFKYSTSLALMDLCIDQFTFRSVDFPALALLSPLLTYSLNRRTRYEDALQKHSAESSSWFESHMKLSMESIREDILKEPYLFTNRIDFQKLNHEAVGLTYEQTTALTELFGYSPSDQFAGQRHSCRYEVWNNPLLKIGDELFCPIMFFASNMWFYSFIHRALLIKAKDSKSSVETEAMENYLGKKFERQGWKVKVIGRYEANKLDGDTDLIIEDQNEVLLIQLKRTYLRLNVRDSYAETRMIDRKAADQLNRAENYLRTENELFNLRTKCRKWIVTTSLEGIQSEISGCRKINYFELLLALKEPGIQTLHDLIQYVEHDEHLHVLCEAALSSESDPKVKEFLHALGLPIPVFESKAYHVNHITTDEPATTSYTNLYNSAVEAGQRNEKNKAIELLHQCTLIHPADADAWSALANCLSDVKQYHPAFICFEKALALLPGDPFISRNFAITLSECGRTYEGISKLLDLLEKYPLMTTLKRDVAMHLYHAVLYKQVSATELKALEERLRGL